MARSMFYLKQVDTGATNDNMGMRRKLGLMDLIALGVGSIMGTGVFVLTGKAAVHAGPGVVMSFAIAACCAALSAMCYAEMAGMLPVAGSAYVYAYATLGEVVAFNLGWLLSLVYLVGAATLSVGWSGYASTFVEQLGLPSLPLDFITAPVAYNAATGMFHLTGGYGNLPAAFIILAVAALLNRGVLLSLRVTALIVFIKFVVVLLFVGFCWPHVQPAHWAPLVPVNRGSFGDLGPSGVLQGAMLLFFAYMGFDAVSAAASETKRPSRDLPLAILISLTICAALYIAVAATLTGLVPYEDLNVPYPLAVGARAAGAPWLERVVDGGAVIGLSTVLLSQLYVLPRVLMAMAQDGLLPAFAKHLHPVHRVPHRLTWMMAMVSALGAAILPVDLLAEFSSLGILLLFAIIAVGVSVQRLREPLRPRSFKVPGGPFVVPGLTIITSVGLMACAGLTAKLQIIVWMALGLVVYMMYSRPRAATVQQGPSTKTHLPNM